MKTFFAQFITLALVVNCIVGLFLMEIPQERFMLWQQNEHSQTLLVIGLFFSVFTTAYILLQAILACCYRVKKTISDDELPRCAVLIPAYNESAQVAKAIESVLNSNYPADKLEVVAIDDGSEDDTWEWICCAAAKSNGRVRALRQAKNGGKKRALCRGIRETTNEIIVTVDSDSSLVPDAIRNLVSGFAANERIGAVAGSIRVRNMESGLLPRMLDVAFVFGCDFMRSAQSTIGTVLCTPGAISAYRRSAVLPLLDTWLAQSFLGAPATIGEDRALTSLLLRNSYSVICQNNAIAYTDVPRNYSGLCKMLLRWTRGDVRESLMLLDYVFSRWTLRDWKWILFQINIISQIIGIALPFIFIPCTVYTLIQFRDNLLFLLYYTFSINGIWSLLPAAVYAKRCKFGGALWAFVYGIFSLIALSWICIYSILTLRNSKWLTRSRQAK